MPDKPETSRVLLTIHLPLPLDTVAFLLGIAAKEWPGCRVGADEDGNTTIIGDPDALSAIPRDENMPWGAAHP